MKYLIIIWALTLLLDNLLPFILACFYPHYSHRQTALSVLGARQSPVKRIYNFWCILSGAVFCVAPYAPPWIFVIRSSSSLCSFKGQSPETISQPMPYTASNIHIATARPDRLRDRFGTLSFE